MKITDVRTMVVENEPMQGFAPTSSERAPGQPRYVGGKHLLFLEIVTDEGIIGLGERVTGNGIGNAPEAVTPLFTASSNSGKFLWQLLKPLSV